jgi:hypothetical protein
MLSACVTQPKGLEPCLRVLQDMRQCGLDLDRHYYRPLMDLLGYDALQMQRVLEPFRQHVGFLEVDDEALAALLFAACRTGLSLEQAAARLNGIGVGLPAMTMIYLRLDQPRSAMIMGKSIETRRHGLGKGRIRLISSTCIWQSVSLCWPITSCGRPWESSGGSLLTANMTSWESSMHGAHVFAPRSKNLVAFSRCMRDYMCL